MDFLYSIYHLAEKILNSFHRDRPKTLGEKLDSHYEQDDFSPVANPNFGHQLVKTADTISDPPKSGSNLVSPKTELVVSRFAASADKPLEPLAYLGEEHDILFYEGTFKVIVMNDNNKWFGCTMCGALHHPYDLFFVTDNKEPDKGVLVCPECAKNSGKTFREIFDQYKKSKNEVLAEKEAPPANPPEEKIEEEDLVHFESLNSHEKTLFYKCHCCGVENPDSELQLIRNDTRNTYAVICKKCLVDNLKDMKEWIKEYGKNWDEEPLRPVEEEKPRLTPLEKLQLRRKMREEQTGKRNARRRERYAEKKEEKN